jgi:hypothetical protein
MDLDHPMIWMLTWVRFNNFFQGEKKIRLSY